MSTHAQIVPDADFSEHLNVMQWHKVCSLDGRGTCEMSPGASAGKLLEGRVGVAAALGVRAVELLAATVHM